MKRLSKHLASKRDSKRVAQVRTFVPTVNASFFKRRGRRHEPDVPSTHR